MISTRGRYALRVLIDLAEHADGGYIPMKAVAARQQISFKYLEQIMPILIKEKLVVGVPGKGGGYRLNRPADECAVGEILRLTEGSLAPVACLSCGEKACDRAGQCKTLPMWQQYNAMVNRFFDGITIADLVNGALPAFDANTIAN